MVRRIIRKFTHAFAGIYFAAKGDVSFQTQVVGGFLFVGVVGYITRPITETELLLLGLSWFLLLITEIQNSSLERALNRLHPELNEDINKE